MANLRIVHTNVFDDATVTASTTADSLSASNTQNTGRDSVYRSTNTSSTTVSWTWGGEDRTIGGLFLFRHKLHGASVRWQAYSDAAYTTPASPFSDSGTVAAASSIAIGSYRWGGDSGSTEYTDLLYTRQPYALWVTPTIVKSVKLTISGTPGAYSYFEICRAFGGPYFEPFANPDYGLALSTQTNTARARSGGGSNRTLTGDTWRQLEMTVGSIPEADRPIWDDLMAYLATGRDCVLSLFPEAGGRAERDYTLNGQFVDVDPLTWANVAFRSKRLTFTEN